MKYGGLVYWWFRTGALDLREVVSSLVLRDVIGIMSKMSRYTKHEWMRVHSGELYYEIMQVLNSLAQRARDPVIAGSRMLVYFIFIRSYLAIIFLDNTYIPIMYFDISYEVQILWLNVKNKNEITLIAMLNPIKFIS